MFEYRVTKYNPAFRDDNGAYTKPEWTSISDIGKTFGGFEFTIEEYERVEGAYIDVALSFIKESESEYLSLRELENSQDNALPVNPDEPDLSHGELRQLVKGILREKYWAKISGTLCFIHFGWDYYMYIGVYEKCEKSIALASESGLFVESFLSPYGERTAKSCLVKGNQTELLWNALYPLEPCIPSCHSRAIWVEYLPALDLTHCRVFNGMLMKAFRAAIEKLGLTPVWFEAEKNKRNSWKAGDFKRRRKPR